MLKSIRVRVIIRDVPIQRMKHRQPTVNAGIRITDNHPQILSLVMDKSCAHCLTTGIPIPPTQPDDNEKQNQYREFISSETHGHGVYPLSRPRVYSLSRFMKAGYSGRKILSSLWRVQIRRPLNPLPPS